MLKRIGLFFVINFLFIVTISLIVNLLGIQPYLTQNGIDYVSLFQFCLVWGMAGSVLSLMLSRVMAKWMLGVQVIDPNSASEYSGLVNMVHDVAKRAGLPAMPEVGVYDSPEVNAFATGPTKSRALVACSTGLLRAMDRNELEGVIGHEISHISNGDMVTMTLVQGIVNAFVMFLSRVLAFIISQGVKEDAQPMVRLILTIVFDIVIGLLGMMATSWFSRRREFRADRGSAGLVGREKMTAALAAIGRTTGRLPIDERAGSLATLKISGKPGGFLALLSTHPPLEERIAALNS